LTDPRPWRRFATAFRGGLHGVSAAPLVFTTSVATMAAGLLLLGAYLLIVFNMRSTLERFGGAVNVVAFLAPGQDPDADRVEELRAQLRAIQGVESVEFVPRDVALGRLRDDLGEDLAVLEDLKENPLPASFEMRLASAIATPGSVRALAEEVAKIDGVEDARYGEQWVAGYERMLLSVQRLGLGVGFGLLLLLGFMVGGTVRLAVYTREDEIQIQRLVGASGLYVRLPFYVQGALQGVIGGAVSIGFLYAGFRLGLPLLGDSIGFLVADGTWVFLSPAWVLAVCRSSPRSRPSASRSCAPRSRRAKPGRASSRAPPTACSPSSRRSTWRSSRCGAARRSSRSASARR
jgi:cell division transport system permease protein